MYFQDYLEKSALEITEAAIAKSARVSFNTFPAHPDSVEGFETMLGKYIDDRFDGVKYVFNTSRNVALSSEEGYSHTGDDGRQVSNHNNLSGIIYGPPEPVLDIRSFLVSNVLGVPLAGLSLSISETE